jgi:hypothetical protein
MDQLQHITARGSGLWGGRRYDVELTTTTTTWADSLGERSATVESYGLHCSEPVGWRYFGSDSAARTAFIAASFTDLEMQELDSPEERVPPQPFESVIGEELSSVEFVRDYVQLRFSQPTPEPLRVAAHPRGRHGP